MTADSTEDLTEDSTEDSTEDLTEDLMEDSTEDLMEDSILMTNMIILTLAKIVGTMTAVTAFITKTSKEVMMMTHIRP